MRTIRSIATGCVVTAVLLGGTTVTASAQSETMTDRRADVTKLEQQAGGVTTKTVLDKGASVASGIDVTSSTVKHGKKSLRITTRFAFLSTRNVSITSVISVKGAGRTFVIENDERSNFVHVSRLDGSKVYCTVKLTYRAGENGYTTYTIPRSCIKNPRSIAVSTSVERTLLLDYEHYARKVLLESVAPDKSGNSHWTRFLKPS